MSFVKQLHWEPVRPPQSQQDKLIQDMVRKIRELVEAVNTLEQSISRLEGKNK